mmetsp:Transcript_61340/g.164750  ORF Transcript_61340/g.164750 Transcript_61340/m.164750 type:complete len:200 (-) Transcript_61340:400-999(-)
MGHHQEPRMQLATAARTSVPVVEGILLRHRMPRVSQVAELNLDSNVDDGGRGGDGVAAGAAVGGVDEARGTPRRRPARLVYVPAHHQPRARTQHLAEEHSAAPARVHERLAGTMADDDVHSGRDQLVVGVLRLHWPKEIGAENLHVDTPPAAHVRRDSLSGLGHTQRDATVLEENCVGEDLLGHLLPRCIALVISVHDN